MATKSEDNTRIFFQLLTDLIAKGANDKERLKSWSEENCADTKE
jgi:hypothetical protein